MANSKAIGVIIVVIVAIIAAYVFSQDQEDVSNEISIAPIQDSSVSISDSATITQNNPDYIIDEEGNKKFFISVSDDPVVAP